MKIKMVGRQNKKKPELTAEELKAKIVKVACQHFAKFGLSGTSLKDVAAEAEVAGSLINYHFKDKDGLFRACVEPVAKDRQQAIARILSEVKSAEEMRVRIEMFVEEMQCSIISDISFFEIVDREMRAGNPMVLSLFQDTMFASFKGVQHFFGRAIENGFIREHLDPLILATLLFTMTCDMARKDHIGERFMGITLKNPEWRKKVAQHISELFLKGVMR